MAVPYGPSGKRKISSCPWPRENTELPKWNCPPQGNRRRLAPFKKGPAMCREVTFTASLVVILSWTGQAKKYHKDITKSCMRNEWHIISDSTSWCGVFPVVCRYSLCIYTRLSIRIYIYIYTHICRDYRGRECLWSIYSTAYIYI